MIVINSGSGSFQSVLGEVGVVQGSKTPVDPALGQLVTPPGLPGLPGPAVPAAVAPAPVVSVGENLNENLRNLELPKLPPDSTSVDFGDWLAIVGPCGTSSQWVTSTPLQRLRLKVVSPTELAKWPRTEQRAVTMLLAAVPDPIRRELISSRKLQSVEILYALLCRFQPGGVHEKTSLLKDVMENSTTLHYTKSHYTTLHFTTLHYTTTLHSTTLQLHNYTPLQYTPLH